MIYTYKSRYYTGIFPMLLRPFREILIKFSHAIVLMFVFIEKNIVNINTLRYACHTQIPLALLNLFPNRSL